MMEERRKSDRIQKVRRRILQDNKDDDGKGDNDNAKGDDHIKQLLEEERKRQQLVRNERRNTLFSTICVTRLFSILIE